MERIGRYKIVGELGRGAMGIVYSAIDPSIGRRVAIKTIRLTSDDPQQREKLQARLFREARSAGMLSHPGIVTIYDVAEEGDMAYIAMEYVDGPSLEAVMAAGLPVDARRIVKMLEQTAAALDYAHGKGIVHRDIKPGNLMLGEDGQTKITDFGIAKLAASDRLTHAGLIVGTPSYMSPEQVQGHAVDGRADQYSLCVVAFELLTGDLPFSGEHLTTVVYKIVCEEPPAPQRLNSALGPRIDSVLRRGLSKKPESRYGSCEEFAAALISALGATPGWRSAARGAAHSQPTAETPEPAKPAPARAAPSSRARQSAERSHSNAPLLLTLAAGLAFVLWAAWPLDRFFAQPPPPETPKAAEAPPLAAPAPPEQKPSPMQTPETQPAATAPAPVPEEPSVPAPAPAPSRRASRTFPQQQEVVVSSTPSGARIVLDERPETACNTPCAVLATPGRHTITASLEGYPREIRAVQVAEGGGAQGVSFTLKRATGTLMVASTPPGAAILIDGRRQASATPAEIALPPGRYSVVLDKDGSRKTQQVDIHEGITVLRVTLEP